MEYRIKRIPLETNLVKNGVVKEKSTKAKPKRELTIERKRKKAGQNKTFAPEKNNFCNGMLSLRNPRSRHGEI